MSRGSGMPMDRLLLLQARAEVMRAQKDRVAPPALECTTFAVGGHRTAGGAVLYGQNVDLVPFLQEYGVVVRQYPKDAPATLLYTTAGLLGHNGLNEAGVGICANFINDPADWGDGLPRYLLSRLALRQESAERALEAALTPPRAASRNLLIADAARRLPGRRGAPQGGRGDPRQGRSSRPRQSPRGAGVRRLRDRSREFLHGGAASRGAARGRDGARSRSATSRASTATTPMRPHSLCAHPFPGRNVQTVASLIGDLTSLELHLAKGSPCQSAYATYTLATCRQGSLSVEVRDRFLEVADAS